MNQVTISFVILDIYQAIQTQVVQISKEDRQPPWKAVLTKPYSNNSRPALPGKRTSVYYVRVSLGSTLAFNVDYSGPHIPPFDVVPTFDLDFESGAVVKFQQKMFKSKLI